MEVEGAGTAAEQVHAAAPELPRARAGEQEVQRAGLDEPVDLVQELGQALHLVDHHEALVVPDLGADETGIAAQCQVDRCVEQVVDARTGESVAEERRLAGLTRPEQKVRLGRQPRCEVDAAIHVWALASDRRLHRHLSYEMTMESTIHVGS